MAKRKYDAPKCKCGKTFAHGPDGDYCTRCDWTPEISDDKTYLTFCQLKSRDVPNRKDAILNHLPGVWVSAKVSIAVDNRILRHLDSELFFTHSDEYYAHPDSLNNSQLFAVSLEEHFHRLDLVIKRVLAKDVVRFRILNTVKDYMTANRTGYMIVPDIADVTEMPEE